MTRRPKDAKNEKTTMTSFCMGRAWNIQSYTGIHLCILVTSTSPTVTHILPTSLSQGHPPTDRQQPPASPSACCPTPSHPPLPAIRANLPVANALVLTIHGAALWINALLPWHQVLVALGSPCGWPAHDYHAFHKPAITEKAYIPEPTKYIMAYNNT